MPIIKQTSAPNGVALGFHKAKSAAVDFGTGLVTVSVQSWPIEEAYVGGAPPAWTQPVVVSVADLGDVDAGLLASDLFAGGTVVSDQRETLAGRQARAWARIKDERTRRMAGTFDHNGHTYDIDPTNITGAALDAQIAIATGDTSWEQMWVLHDNTTVTLTATQMIAAARACKAAVSGLWATSQYLRSLIYADPPPEDFEAITWP